VNTKDIISSGLLELFVLGMTNAQETAQVSEMAALYPEVLAEIRAIEMSLQSYAMLHAVQPATHIKKTIFSRLSATKEQKTNPVVPVVSISPFWKYAAAASVILLVGSIVMNVNYYRSLEISKSEKQQIEQQLLAQERVNDEMKNNLSIIQSKYSEPVSLHGLQAAPDAAAKIFWMKNTGEVYIDPSNLPEAPEGMQYQLWGIVDGKPVDGGLILKTKKDNKYRILKMKSFGKAEAFAVTLETAGGNPTPKGDMYVMGKM